MDRKCVGSEWRKDRPPPTKVLPRHRCATTVFGGGGRGRPRPYGKVGTLMERGSHFGRLGRWLGDVGRDQPSERRRRDHGSDGRAGSSRRGRRGGVVGWPKRRPARGPLGVPRVVLRVSSGRPELRPAPRSPNPGTKALHTMILSTSLGRLRGVGDDAEGSGDGLADPVRRDLHDVGAVARRLPRAVPVVGKVVVRAGKFDDQI